MRRKPATADSALEKVRRVERQVEREIRAAIERGALSGLSGEGRPLPPDPDERAGERWASAHILRNAKLAPHWAELRREILDSRGRLVRTFARHGEWLEARRAELGRLPAERILQHSRETDAAGARVAAELDDALAGLNAQIARHNLLVPVGPLQLVPLTRERLESLAAEGG